MPTSSKGLQLTHVFNMYSGKIDSVEQYLNQGERNRTLIRRHLTDCYRAGKKHLVCPLCHGALFIREGGKRPHFVHYETKEFESCPYKDTHNHLTPEEIKMRQYNGVQESARHKNLKNTVGNILQMDNNFSNPVIDKCYIYREKHERMRPDIQTLYNNKKVVFEIQLSKEFITIISKRENYYRENEAFLIWIFDNFSNTALSIQSSKDIFYPNNSQRFYVDKFSLEKSKKEKLFYFNVAYHIPFINETSMTIEDSLVKKEISLNDLTFDQKNYSVYFYNYRERYMELKLNIIHRKIKNLVKLDYFPRIKNYICRITGISENFDFQLKQFLTIMLSAKEGTLFIDENHSLHKKTKNIFNESSTGVKPSWFFYFYTVLMINHPKFYPSTIHEELKRKIRRYKNEIINNPTSTTFIPCKKSELLFAFLFPNEYKNFLKLMSSLKLPWVKIDSTRFDNLHDY